MVEVQSPRRRRDYVRFFDDVEGAESAGFRACRRCDPKGDRAALAGAVVADTCAFIEREEAIPSLLDLLLDLHGTLFRRRVWAVRAVARSCATNPVSLAVPCHRVVGSGGDLTGYRWGVGHKRELLAREAAARRGT